MADLKTDYKDDVLDTTQNTKRKYQMIDNGDGTVSFEDVTEYLQQGDSFGADDINDTNEEVNIINDKLTDEQSAIQAINDKLTDEQSAIQAINDKLTDEQSAIQAINDNLNDKKYFIDTSTIISNIQSDTDWVNATRTITYNATQNCSINGQIAAKLSGNVNIHINDVIISRITCDVGAVYTPCNFLLKSGDTIKFVTNGNTYFVIKAFGLK